MRNNEKELIELLRSHDDPVYAVKVAVQVVLEFLRQQKMSSGNNSENQKEESI